MFNIFAFVIFVQFQEYPEFTRVLKNPLEGRKIFVEKGCITCHSLKGTGGKLGPDLGEITERLTFFRFAGLLFNHSPRMLKVAEEMGISWALLTPGEIASLFGYLYYLNYFEKQGNFERGKAVFREKKCNICHSVKGGKFDLEKYAHTRTPIFLFVGMWNNADKMIKEINRRRLRKIKLTGNDFIDILAYIRGFAKKDEKVKYLKPGNPERGQKVFKEKGCGTCHSILGEDNKGKLGPDLGKLENIKALSDVLSNLWNHIPDMMEIMRGKGIKIPSFTYEEMSDLLSFLYSIQYYDEKGDIEKGKKVYIEKECGYCHDRGKAVKLTNKKVLSSPFVFTAALWLSLIHI